jgi:hypothetical protein
MPPRHTVEAPAALSRVLMTVHCVNIRTSVSTRCSSDYLAQRGWAEIAERRRAARRSCELADVASQLASSSS